MDNFIGKRIEGRYQIEELIGTGGMANVYKAIDLKENRTVAVKVLREELMDNQDLVRRFKNESKAISVLNHPNIVKVYDVSVTEKLQYIVMEYIDGITLKEYMEQRGQALTYKETLHFVTQVLIALQHAHEKGIVHRDIKPQNIMLLLDSSIKVMDFGIARFSRSESQTITDKAIGSVHYISPEQAKGDSTDLKADIYSVGVMMYEMLTGKLPFESDSAVSVAIKQISDKAIPVREINPAVPEGLESITARAMSKDPKDRYQSAKEMLFDIEEFKKNPSVRFEYKYLSEENSGARYVDKVSGKSYQRSKAPVRSNVRTATATRKKKSFALPILAGMALAFAVGAAILVYLILKMSGNEFFSKVETVTLPNFVGMVDSDIKENDRYASFNIDWVYVYDNTEAGRVFSQSPKPPKEVKANAKITLKVSKGVQIVEVPNVIGWTKEDARNAFNDLGITVMLKPQQTSEVTAGLVMSTDPVAGTSVSSGDTVVIYYAQGQQEISTTVPDITNMLVADAQATLASRQLFIGTTNRVESELPEGTILEQTPAAGAVVTKGTSISVTVSLGFVTPPPPTTFIVPDFSANHDGATIVYIDSDLPQGTFISQAPVAGTEVEIGTAITVFLSNGIHYVPPTPPAPNPDD